jgi:2-phospho-L-lactate guanylyltransferase
MAAIVVPFRGVGGKSRLAPAPVEVRTALALAMLADVVSACVAVAETIVITADPAGAAVAEEHGARTRTDPGGGQGAAVRSALDTLDDGPVAVVNADVPCVVPDDVRELLAAAPPDGLAAVAASDGTTNALALANPRLFRPLYGPGSAARFLALAPSRRVEIPSLVEDVDTLADLERIAGRVGPRTLAARSVVAVPVPQ